MKQSENINYHSDISSWNNSVYSHWPDSSLGYSNSNTGSDVLKIIEQFLDNTQVPICGAIIHISLKRWPNERNIESLVSRIRENHGTVTVVIPTNPSGGLYYQTMYELATKTNGLGFFAAEDQGYSDASFFINNWDRWPLFVYSVNVNVSQSGSITLPSLSMPFASWNYFLVTFQDSGVLSTFQSMNLTLKGSVDSYSLTESAQTVNKLSNFIIGTHYFNDTAYDVTLDYNFSDSRQQTLQIRLSDLNAINYWIPYAD